MIRKFGILGDSTIMSFPPKLIKDLGIEQGGYGIFKQTEEGILIKPVDAKELKI
jgi:antitoxin component of MazEF toxin-antitoxin module